MDGDPRFLFLSLNKYTPIARERCSAAHFQLQFFQDANTKEREREAMRGLDEVDTYLEGKVPSHSLTARSISAVSAVIGISIIMTSCLAVIMLLLGSVELTHDVKHLAGGVPVILPMVNEPVYFPLMVSGCVSSIGLTAFSIHTSTVSSRDELNAGRSFRWHATYPYVIGGVLSGVAVPGLVRQFYHGLLSYYTIRGMVLIVFGSIGAVVIDKKLRVRKAKSLQKLKLHALKLRAAESNDQRHLRLIEGVTPEGLKTQISETKTSVESDGKKTRTISMKERKTAFARFVGNFAGLFNAISLSLYTALLFSFYFRMGDGGRLIFVCAIHPCIVEFISLCLRCGFSKRASDFIRHEKDPIDVDRFLFNQKLSMINTMFTDVMFAFVRRCLISAMKSPASTTAAIMLTGIEEIALRTTIKKRDRMFQSSLGIGKSTNVQNEKNTDLLAQAREHLWIDAIGMSMISETVAIFSRFAGIALLQPHKSIFVLGFPSDTDPMLLFNFALEVVSEFTVDIVACYSEILHGINVDRFFISHMRIGMQYMHILAVTITGFLLGLCCVTNVPNFILCTDPNDICSCAVNKHFPFYVQYCDGTSNVTQLQHGGNASNTLTNKISESDMNAFLLAFISFITIVAIALASNAYLKNSKQRRVFSTLQRKNRETSIQLLQLQKQMSSEQQRSLMDKMETEKYAPMAGYSIPRSHINMEKIIGQGAAGEVWLGTYRSEQVAVKKVLWGGDFESAASVYRKEALVMAQIQGEHGISHGNLVQMLHCCWEKELLIVIEFFELGSLDGMLEEEWARPSLYWCEEGIGKSLEDVGPLLKLSRGIAAGMAFLHSIDIVHRDLKPANVLIDGIAQDPAGWEARVSDFGEAREMDTEITMTMKGTPLFMAPEVILCSVYDHRADIYSFGMMCLSMLTFDCGGLHRCWKESSSGRFSMQAVATGNSPWIPSEVEKKHVWLASLIRQCIASDPESRPGSFDVVIDELWRSSTDLTKAMGKSHRSRTSSSRTSPNALKRSSSNVALALEKEVKQLKRELQEARGIIKISTKRQRSASIFSLNNRRSSVHSPVYSPMEISSTAGTGIMHPPIAEE